MIPFSRAARTAACVAALACAVLGAAPAALAVPRGGPTTGSGFVAQSITWFSPQRAWLLGANTCGGHPCTQVRGTSNGGVTWHLIGKIPAGIPKAGNAGTGVQEIRFVTLKLGWAFGPDLFRTTDGGKTWRAMPIPGGGKQVLGLAVNPTGAFAIVSPCGYAAGVCTKKPLSVWRTMLGQRGWTRLSPRPHINSSASIAIYANTLYVVDPRLGPGSPSQLLVSKDDGQDFSARPVPCGVRAQYNLVQADPTSSAQVALLCVGDIGFGKAVKTVYLSNNTGKNDRYAGMAGLYGIQAEISMSMTGQIAMAATSIGTFMFINDNHAARWYMIIGSGDGGAGFNDLTYVSSRVAWVVYGPADLYSGYGQVYVTRDAGRKWTLVKT